MTKLDSIYITFFSLFIAYLCLKLKIKFDLTTTGYLYDKLPLKMVENYSINF